MREGPSQHGGRRPRRHFRRDGGYKGRDFRSRSFPAVTTSSREHACEFLGAGFGAALAPPPARCPHADFGARRALVCPPHFRDSNGGGAGRCADGSGAEIRWRPSCADAGAAGGEPSPGCGRGAVFLGRPGLSVCISASRSSPRTSSTPLQKRRRGNTRRSAWCRAPTPTSWT